MIPLYAHSPSDTTALGEIKSMVGRKKRLPQFIEPLRLHFRLQAAMALNFKQSTAFVKKQRPLCPSSEFGPAMSMPMERSRLTSVSLQAAGFTRAVQARQALRARASLAPPFLRELEDLLPIDLSGISLPQSEQSRNSGDVSLVDIPPQSAVERYHQPWPLPIRCLQCNRLAR